MFQTPRYLISDISIPDIYIEIPDISMPDIYISIPDISMSDIYIRRYLYKTQTQIYIDFLKFVRMTHVCVNVNTSCVDSLWFGEGLTFHEFYYEVVLICFVFGVSMNLMV